MKPIESFEPLWGEWRTKRLLGQGSYGMVYLAEKIEFGNSYYAAIKHIPLPQNQGQIQELFNNGLAMDDASAHAYYSQVMESLLDEININYKLKGHSNVVSYEEHKIEPRTDMPGYDIFIKMELLTSLPEHIAKHPMTIGEIVKLGVDLCSALMLLQKETILHRDVKPANIFVSSSGSFKLGDFGVARTLDKTVSELSVKGTFAIMAPELARGGEGDHRIDIYSLGLVLYRLLNGNRGPFLPLPPAVVTHESNQLAMKRRLQGERLPMPAFADQRLWSIIQKACEPDPSRRWQNAEQMREALQAYGTHISLDGGQRVVLVVAKDFYETPNSQREADLKKEDNDDLTEMELTLTEAAPMADHLEPTVVEQAGPSDEPTADDELAALVEAWFPEPEKENRKKSRGRPFFIAACLLVAICTGIVAAFLWGGDSDAQGAEPSPGGEALLSTSPDQGKSFLLQDGAVEQAVLLSLQLHHAIEISPEEVTQAHLQLITTLVIDQAASSLEDLRSMPNLVGISIEDQTQTYSMEPLSACANLQWLSISNCEPLLADETAFRSLAAALETLENLTRLALKKSGLTDDAFAGIGSLPSLLYLNIDENQVNDLTPVAQMTTLEEVSFSHNPVRDLTPLSALSNLQKVGAEGCAVTDWSAVSHVETVSGRPETDLTGGLDPATDPTPSLAVSASPKPSQSNSNVSASASPSKTPAPATSTPASSTKAPTPTPTPTPVPTPTPAPATPQTVAVTGISISQTGYVMDVGQTGQLSATVSPSNATSKTVSWSSSNSNVATVDASGRVRAIASGKATITASCGGYSASCSITVG